MEDALQHGHGRQYHQPGQHQFQRDWHERDDHETDAECNDLARDAGLDGTFVSWLVTPTEDGGDPARWMSARGWVRPDGRPFADRFEELVQVAPDDLGTRPKNTAASA